MNNLIPWLEVACLMVVAIFIYQRAKERVKYPLHMIQLQGYDNPLYYEWCEENKDHINRWVYEEGEEKTPLVMTERAQRLLDKSMLLTAGLLAGIVVIRLIVLLNSGKVGHIVTVMGILLMVLIYYRQFKIVGWANRLNEKIEDEINMGYYRQAQNKIREYKSDHHLRVVGITGSFGKTSTKFITNTILREKFNILETPSSYNTPMGLSKVINNDLTQDQEVFVAELGAKVPGEIREVAELVQPNIGVITAIGPTHMHLFKTIENIQETKYELIEALGQKDVAIFNYDNEYIKPMVNRTKIKTMLYGLEDIDKLDVYAREIEVDERGSRFILGIRDLGEKEVTTKLLGKHNISNLLAAVSIAYTLEMSFDEICAAIPLVEPVEHRLSLIQGAQGMTIIDDTFNSNPVGARAALEVLDTFKTDRKMILTPGMVELGAMEEEENYKFGKEIAKVADYVLLVGKQRTKPIENGLRDAGFNMDHVLVGKDLNEATTFLTGLATPGSVVLFENDLPDNYNEM